MVRPLNEEQHLNEDNTTCGTSVPFTHPEGKMSDVDKFIVDQVLATKDPQLVTLCLNYFGPGLLYFLDDDRNSGFDKLPAFFPNEEIREQIGKELEQVEKKEILEIEDLDKIIQYLIKKPLTAPDLLNCLLLSRINNSQEITDSGAVNLDEKSNLPPIIEESHQLDEDPIDLSKTSTREIELLGNDKSLFDLDN